MASKKINELPIAPLPLVTTDKIIVSRDGVNVNQASIQNVASVIVGAMMPSFTTLSELNTALPPQSTPEGYTALVGATGAKVEYINLNGAWQIRAVVVIG